MVIVILGWFSFRHQALGFHLVSKGLLPTLNQVFRLSGPAEAGKFQAARDELSSTFLEGEAPAEPRSESWRIAPAGLKVGELRSETSFRKEPPSAYAHSESEKEGTE